MSHPVITTALSSTASPQASSPDHHSAGTAGGRAATPARSRRTRHPVLVIMGISGSGKSTVAALLGADLGWDVQEGDDLHPAGNIAKMAAGQPLTDEDRWPWLDRVAAWISDHNGSNTPGIITCSALKRAYRDRLRGADVIFVHLRGSRDQIGRRIAARSDHFMPAALLDSQISTLEVPGPDENTIVVDVEAGPAAITADVIGQLESLDRSRSTARARFSPPRGPVRVGS